MPAGNELKQATMEEELYNLTNSRRREIAQLAQAAATKARRRKADRVETNVRLFDSQLLKEFMAKDEAGRKQQLKGTEEVQAEYVRVSF